MGFSGIYRKIAFAVAIASSVLGARTADAGISLSEIPLVQDGCGDRLSAARTSRVTRLSPERITASFSTSEVAAILDLTALPPDGLARVYAELGDWASLNLAFRMLFISWHDVPELSPSAWDPDRLRGTAEALAQLIASHSSLEKRKLLLEQVYGSLRKLVVADPNVWESNPGINPILHRLLDLRVREITEEQKRFKFRQGQRTSSRFPNENTYMADDPELLLSPPALIDEVVSTVNPKPGKLWVDIGSGFGNFGFYIGIHRPDQRFVGYEIVPERVTEATRVSHALGLSDLVRFEETNVGDDGFELPDADYIYLFNALSERTTRRIFLRLKNLAQRKDFALIVESDLNYGEEIHWPGRIAKDQKWLKLRISPNEKPGFLIFDTVAH